MKTSCYCEIEFLKQFVSNIPDRDPFADDNDFVIWRNFKKLILENSRLTIDNGGKLDEWVRDNRENKLAVILYKKKQVAEINEMRIDNVDFETINPHTVFLMADTQKCNQLEEDYGMMFISNETKNGVAEILFGFEQSEISIAKTSGFSDYNFIARYRHPCNSMIINDAYLLSEPDCKFDENLIALLKNLLPEKLNKDKTSFHLTIISGDNKKNINVKDRYSIIKAKIDALNKPYPIELKISGKQAEHNRNIITNYLRINAGHTFTLFEKNRLKISDTFTVSSITGNPDAKKCVDDLEKEYKKIEQQTSNIGTQIVVMPEKQAGKASNRLLK
jgi:hypothetical protein